MSTFGLIGTITSDTITREDGPALTGLGGILYQAAVLCGLAEDVLLYSNCGAELETEVRSLIGAWPTLCTNGLEFVPGPGNRVFLRYSGHLKEREEVLEFVVPPLDASRVLPDLDQLDMLLMVFNSGFDMTLDDWRKLAAAASCPTWLDIHSLTLARHLRRHREYKSLSDWKDWVSGISYLQANRQEVACMLGHPERWPDRSEIAAFLEDAFRIGLKAVFITMGKEGTLASTPDRSCMMRAPRAKTVVDTTGCGDVFCAGAMHGLAGGASISESASFGIQLASRAVGLAGVRKTYEMARDFAARKF